MPSSFLSTIKLFTFCFLEHFFFLLIFLRVVLGSQKTWAGRTEISHLSPAPTHTHPSRLPTSSVFVTIYEPTYLRHYYPESLVYIGAHSWWCIFHRLEQMYNNMYVSTIIILYGILSLKILCASAVHLSFPTILGNHSSLLSLWFCVFQDTVYLEPYSIRYLQIGFFHLVIYI